MLGLSILLLTKNGLSDLERLLPALYGQQGIGSFEVIAIDSGSTDGTIELLQKYPLQLVQIPPATFHHARTRNLAAGLARGESLILLSQDAIPASDLWLKRMVANFDDPTVGAVYGRHLPKPGAFLERQVTLDAVYGARKVVKDPAHPDGLGYRFYHFSDANAAIRRGVWDATRFPDDLKVFEDMGIAKRILDQGWKIVYDPEAAVYHSHNHNTLGLFKRYFDLGYTLKLLKIWDTPGIRKSLSRDARNLLLPKIKRTNSDKSTKRTTHGIQQVLVKSFGLFLGINQALLPLRLKRHLSAFRLFG